jgi:hypothetical protein
MGKKKFSPIEKKRYLSPKTLGWIALALALFISICLAAAAYGKFFYPSSQIQYLEKATSLFELVMICFLILFRKRPWVWVAAAVLFASWGGYAIYWCCLKLPCNCMGSMVPLPSGYALSVDILFFVLSCVMAFLLGAAKNVIYLTVLCAFLCALLGYAFAEWLFFVKFVGVRWVLW